MSQPIYTNSKTKSFNLLFKEEPYKQTYPFHRTMFMEPRLASFTWDKMHYVILYEWKRLLDEYKEKTHNVVMQVHLRNLYISMECYYGNESCRFCVFSDKEDKSGNPLKVWNSPIYLKNSIRLDRFQCIMKDMVETYYTNDIPENKYTRGLKFQ
jgi:hypothetical protein